MHVDQPGQARAPASTEGRRRRRPVAAISMAPTVSAAVDMQGNTCMIGDVADDLNLVFKALADPTRRQLLDRLHQQDGQTLGELCGSLAMARQSASQHLGAAGGGEPDQHHLARPGEVHHLNPVPLHDIQERWIDKFERPRLRALSAIRHSAEEQAMTAQPTYVYVTYIKASPEQVWRALTDADLTAALLGPPQRVGLAAGLDVASTCAPTGRASPT